MKKEKKEQTKPKQEIEDEKFEKAVNAEIPTTDVQDRDTPESKRFPPVRTTTDLFGANEGTILRFDFESGKYVFIIENEEMGPGESYYYSGSAIALDPFLVRRYIGEDFEYAKEVEKEEDQNEGVEAEEYEHVEYEEADLVSVCGQCGKVTTVSHVTGGGQQFIMATTSSAKFEIRCLRCGSSMVLKYRNGVPKEEKEDLTDDDFKDDGTEPIEKPEKSDKDESKEESK